MESEPTARPAQNGADVLFSDKSLLAEIGHKSDVAARIRKVRQYGFQADDVYNEVVVLIVERLAHGKTFQQVVDEVLNRPDRDNSDKAAHSLALGKLCANAAERVIYRAKMERPVGDAPTVTGEETPKEQKELSEQEAANGNDRQMKAVLARKAVNRGVHRADVYGIADWSRRAMRDNMTRSAGEQDETVVSSLMDAIWTPETEVQREAWNAAFWGMSPADVLFGMNPTNGAHPEDQDVHPEVVVDHTNCSCDHKATIYLHTGEYGPAGHDPDKACYYHQKMRNGLIHPAVCYSDRLGDKCQHGGNPVYPVGYPYKALQTANTRTPRPEGSNKAHRDKCRYCQMFDPNGTRIAEARKRCEAEQNALMAADPTYERIPYTPPKPPKNCPPGKVIQWRSVETGGLLPESATEATYKALRRAVLGWAQYVQKGRMGYWRDESLQMQVRADIADMLADQAGVGQGVPKVQTVQRLTDKPYVNIWPDDVDSAKDARRWSLMPGMGEMTQYDAYSIVIANVLEGDRLSLPGGERWNASLRDMAVGAIRVSEIGQMWHDGVTGTFVHGLPEWAEWHKTRSNVRRWTNWVIQTVSPAHLRIVTER